MSKITVVPSKIEDINIILNKDIDSIILGVKDLSIYELELDIDSIINISNNTNKKVIIAINKMIHNSDLLLVKDILSKIKNSTIYGILFYDLGVFNLIKKMNIDKELILSQEHLNTSTNSHIFYNNKGINNSFITSDITFNEIKDIKNNTKINIYYTAYGYLPIFYSRRLLLSNYFNYINKDKLDNKYYIYNNDMQYMLIEHNYGTIIYSPLVNLISKINDIKNICNMVIDLSYNNDIDIIDSFINNTTEDTGYIGFYDTETIYKLK